jgi:protein TonB
MATTKTSAEHSVGTDLVFFSKPKRDAGATAEAFSVSVIFHTAIVLAAAWLTIAPPKMEETETNILIPVLEQEEKAQHELPPPPPPPKDQPPPQDVTTQPRGFQTLTVPTYITPEIPPPTAGPEVDEADFSGEGVEGGRGRGEAPPDTKVTSEDISAAPAFTPYTVAPELRNRAEIARLLERHYPPLMRDAGLGGTVMMWVFIDQAGGVKKVLVKESSGMMPLDSAAVKVTAAMRFSPAQNRDIKVPVWVALPIAFTVVDR